MNMLQGAHVKKEIASGFSVEVDAVGHCRYLLSIHPFHKSHQENEESIPTLDTCSYCSGESYRIHIFATQN